MSSIKARLMKPTGLEFHDTAFELDREVWNFLKHEYKNKSKGENGGDLPVRYWQTHGVPIHRECWRMISEITYANSIYPTNDEELHKVPNHENRKGSDAAKQKVIYENAEKAENFCGTVQRWSDDL